MPFALLVLSGDGARPGWSTARSARRSPSCWSAPACTRPRPPAWRWPPTSRRENARPRVVALLYVMLLVGMVASALVFGALLRDFTQIRLIQVIQGAAAVTHGCSTSSRCGSRRRAIPSLTAASTRAARVPAILGAVPAIRRVDPRLLVAVASRHRRLHHAGHPARALWRRDPASQRRADHRADRLLRARHARRASRWPPGCWDADADPYRHRGLRRGGRHRSPSPR